MKGVGCQEAVIPCFILICVRERERGGVTGVGEKEGEKGEEREKGIWIRERSRDRGSGLIAKILHQLYNYQNYQVYAVVDIVPVSGQQVRDS